MNVKEYYTKISKAGNLPKFEQLNNDFHIANVKDMFGRKIAEKIANKAEFYKDMMEKFINSHQSTIRELTELNVMDEVQKQKIALVYSELCLIQRKFLSMDLDGKHAEVDFIIKASEIWGKLKPDLAEIVKFTVKAWKNQIPLKKELNKLGYMG